MAVYERTYRPWKGDATPLGTRFLVFPRYAWEEVLASKLFLAFLVVCLLWPLGIACILYLPHNLGFMKAFQLDPEAVKSWFVFDERFFYNWLMWFQGGFALFATFVVGPALVSTDMRNNGLPLYFSRPITRTDYVLGKMTVLVTLLSTITWIPGMLLFAFQSYLGGPEWARAHWRVGTGILLGSWIWILVLCLLSLALSAYVKWRPVARMGMILIFVVLAGMASVLNVLLRTDLADVINVTNMVYVVWAGLFGIESEVSTPVPLAWLSLLAWCGLCLALLARKLRAYEVVR